MEKVLIVDDNPSVCQALTLLLDLHDIPAKSCHSPAEAVTTVMRQRISLVILDMNFSQDTTSGEEGRDTFYQLRQIQPDLPIILITAWTQLSMAIELVKNGAADYLAKPWDDQKLVTTVQNLLEFSEITETNKQLVKHQQLIDSQLSAANLCGLIFESAAMKRLVDMALQVAKSEATVLISGPNGAGKEKIAEIIQANSTRADKPFIKVNVGALPADLLEAELFGAEAGAYTGNTKTRVGRFEAADGGTLFLDEIGNLPLAGQVKLLRVLQTGEFERLGSHQTKKVNVRVISATNADLLQDIDNGKFREDLYYRLNVVQLLLPKLADRIDDIVPLTTHFVGGDYELSLDAEKALQKYEWPGNVRELENLCQRAKLFAQSSTLSATDFGLTISLDGRQKDKEDYSKDDIIDALDKASGNVSKAAKMLKLSRQALYRRMDKFQLSK